MSLRNFIQDNFVMILELIGLMIVLDVSVHIPKRMKRQTRLVVGLLALETLAFCLERWTQTFETLSPFHPLLTATLFTLYPIILILVIQITTADRLSRRTFVLLMIPVAVSIPLYYTSQWTHLIYWFSEDNTYQGGPLRYWPYVLFGFFALFMLVQNALYFKHYARRIRVAAAYVVVGPILGVLAYLFLGITKDYAAIFTSAILLYYICMYIHMARIDSMTTLLNRQSYYQDLNGHGITGVVSVDMNDLKYYNDNLGHEAGDTALKTVSVVMRDHCGRGGTVYRVGGDEFMILYDNAAEEDIVAAIEEMRRFMAETPYVCAFGYAMKREDETITDTMRRSDAAMYEDKAFLKQKKREQA